jgi:hypothetical protein
VQAPQEVNKSEKVREYYTSGIPPRTRTRTKSGSPKRYSPGRYPSSRSFTRYPSSGSPTRYPSSGSPTRYRSPRSTGKYY